MESDIIPKQNIPITYVSIAGLRGNGIFGWVMAPMRILVAISQVISCLRRFKPALVLGLGGFVTGPGGVAAWLLRIPLVIHEQNAIAGLTNRLLVPFTARVLEAFPNTFTGKKIVHTGNPVRTDILNYDKSKQVSTSVDEINLLVVGGSLGAKALNDVVPETLYRLQSNIKFNVWHQTGKKLFEGAQANYSKYKIPAKVAPFIDDMAMAYHWADLVICRAGALTVAELAAAGVASILVPYPHAVDDHQTANAKYLSDGNAAIVIQQKDLTVEVLTDLLTSMKKEQLIRMGAAARQLALPDATQVVANHCLELANA